jgi:hypothetical protein
MTLFIAIWGAVLGTLTFIWNLWKWRYETPRIVAAVETVESSWTENSFAGIRLKLRNRGGRKTTVEDIFLYRRQKWFENGLVGILFRFSRIVPWQQNVGVSNPNTAKLPVILDVGGSWEGFVPFEANEPDNDEELKCIGINREILKILLTGKLRYSIHCSHTNRRVMGLVRNENNWPRE